MNREEKIKIIDEVTSEVCNNFCKWPEAPIPEGMLEGWLYETGSPCDNCPLEKLEALKND